MRNEKLYGKVFRWDDLPDEAVRPGVRRKAYATDECMMVLNTLQPGMQLKPHSHQDFDQLVYIIDGHCNYFVGGQPHEMFGGSMLLVQAGVEHYIEPIDGPCLNLDIFTPPRADYAHLLSYLNE